MDITELLRFSGESGGDSGQADNSTADGEDDVAACRCDGSNLQRVPLRKVLPVSRRADQR